MFRGPDTILSPSLDIWHEQMVMSLAVDCSVPRRWYGYHDEAISETNSRCRAGGTTLADIYLGPLVRNSGPVTSRLIRNSARTVFWPKLTLGRASLAAARSVSVPDVSAVVGGFHSVMRHGISELQL